METTIIDPISYLRPPRISVRSGLSLCRTLLPLVPEGAGSAVTEAASALEAAGNALEARWKAKQRQHMADDVRAYDRRLDRAWGAIETILSQYRVFDPEDVDRQRAEQLKQRLFPNGLAFLALPYVEQHAESERLVDLIEEEDLREDLDQLVGDNFIEQMLADHKAYGEVLGIGIAGRPSPAPISLTAPLRALAQAITNYALHVLSFGNSAPEHVASARNALEPIDQLRRAIARRKASRSSEPEVLDDTEVLETPQETPQDMMDSEPMVADTAAA